MIVAFKCPLCDHVWDEWRQLSRNMPGKAPCPKCAGVGFPDKGYATIIHFKGEGWTPKGDYIAKDLRDVKGVPKHIGEMLD